MAPALTRTPRRLALAAAALFAVAFLIAMTMSGRTRPIQNLVAFEASGLMSETPDQVDRVELIADGRRATLVRSASGGWRIGAGPGAADLAASFGAKNPQELFQYVQVEGRAALYLVPVFVGHEWERVMDAINTS